MLIAKTKIWPFTSLNIFYNSICEYNTIHLGSDWFNFSMLVWRNELYTEYVTISC